MNNNYVKLRQQHFESNWLAWAALHHFLPTPLLRELSYVIVDRVTNGSLGFNQLFSESVSGEPSALASWVIQPLPETSQIATYLQYRIRAFAWQSDEGGFLSLISDESHGSIAPALLEKAVEFGALDFTSQNVFGEYEQDSGQSSMNHFIQAFLQARSCLTTNTYDCINALTEPLKTVSTPLSAIMLKHFGDLFADVDEWGKARSIYEQVNQQLEEFTEPEWADFTSLIQSITTQSLATSIRYVQGAKESSELLQKSFSQRSMEDAPILFVNGSFDAYVASRQAAPFEVVHDSRSTVLYSPLLLKSHNLSTAMGSWLNGKFTDASTRYWAVLRRQIALGSATESRTTKAWYARNMLEELEQTGSRQGSQKSFKMAVGLLVESGSREIASKVNWSERLVSTFIDKTCLDDVVRHAESHAGSINERRHIVIQLFCVWIEKIAYEQIELTAFMMKFLAKLALISATSDPESNIGGHSLDALTKIAKQRPEFRELICPEILEIVATQLEAQGFWTGTEKALKLASEYISAFSQDQLGKVVETILAMLDTSNPETGMWPIIRPALQLLVTKEVKTLAKEAEDLGQRVISAILRFGLEQESESARVIFYLHDFDVKLLKDPSIKEALQDSLQTVRQSAKRINSSDVVDKIQALLLAPVISGRDGVEDALDGLSMILASAKEQKQSIALPYAYDPLLLLINKKNDIAKAINVSDTAFEDKLKPFLAQLTELWRSATENPLILAGFSFPPPTAVDSIIVHNWAFTSMLFAELFQKRDEMDAVLSQTAEAQPALASGIALALATQLVAEKSDNFDGSAIRCEDRETFYSALGRRLVVLERLGAEKGSALCLVLTEQCLKLGPCEIDAAVFLAAIRLDLTTQISKQSYAHYTKRLDNMRDLRLKLMPILRVFEDSEEANADD